MSCRMEPGMQGVARREHFKALTRYREARLSVLLGTRTGAREAIEGVYPQIFGKLGEKFKKYEHLNSYTGNLLSFNAF